jgi:hypothetical protein
MMRDAAHVSLRQIYPRWLFNVLDEMSSGTPSLKITFFNLDGCPWCEAYARELYGLMSSNSRGSTSFEANRLTTELITRTIRSKQQKEAVQDEIERKYALKIPHFPTVLLGLKKFSGEAHSLLVGSEGLAVLRLILGHNVSR